MHLYKSLLQMLIGSSIIAAKQYQLGFVSVRSVIINHMVPQTLSGEYSIAFDSIVLEERE